MRVSILASGSRGNATLFESPRTRVLVDAGISRRRLHQRLHQLGRAAVIDAIVITHAHRDHVGHCRRLAAHHRVPLYMTEATARETGYDDVRTFSPREPFAIGDLLVTPLPLPHDAAQVALRFSDGQSDAALCTDLGDIPPRLPELLHGCELLLLESNHDLDLLATGPYPEFLKRRIASARGHLSNAQAHALLRVVAPLTRRVVLMHLSETNNRVCLARASAEDAVSGYPVEVLVASQDQPLAVESPSVPKQLAFSF